MKRLALIRNPRRAPRCVAFAVLALTLAVGGCGDSDGCCELSEDVDRSGVAAYAEEGPYPVGYLNLDLADRKVAVFYPAVPGSEVNVPRAQYRQSDPFDPLLASLVENLAARQGIDVSFTMSAFADLPASPDGPFPVVLFSHGFGGWRLVNSTLMAGIASWGFIVAGPDHIERDLNAVASNNVRADSATDRRVLLDVLAKLETESARSTGPLAAIVDPRRVAAAGHSAGGAAALTLLDAPEIAAIVGYASVGAVDRPPAKPTLLIVAINDIVVTPAFTQTIFRGLASPKRLAIIENSGHNSFSDICTAIRSGASLTQLARDAGFPIDPNLLALGENGCAESDAEPRDVWSISQHLTVAHLRHAFGIDDPAVGLSATIGDAFAVPVQLLHE